MIIFAETGEHVHNDTCQHRIVDDIDEYLAQLNAGLIIPTNTTITTYESNDFFMPFGITEPSKSCSNIFGHSWGSWGAWYEVKAIHTIHSLCNMRIERTRYCTRTYCGAYQIEDSLVQLKCATTLCYL